MRTRDNKLEITPEMIAAGVRALCSSYDLGSPEGDAFEDVVVKVYGDMIAVMGDDKGKPISASEAVDAVPTCANVEALIEAASSPSELLSVLGTRYPELSSTQIPWAIHEVAEEIVSRSDVIGIENDSLITLLQVALFLDRRMRERENCEQP